MYNMFYQVLTIVLPLITTPYLSRVLGAEAIGIYGYTLSIATYFILFGTLGVAMYGQREIAYVQDQKKKRSIVFWEILILKFCTMAISITIFYFSFCIHNQYRVYYCLLIIELVSQAIDISWFFQGLEEFKKTVIRNSIVKIVFCILIFVFIKSSDDLIKYVLIITLSNLLGNFSLWMYIPKYLEKVKLKEIKFLRHFKSVIALFIPQIAIQVYTILDKTMIGKIVVDKSEVGYYEQAQKIVKLLLTIVTSLGTVMVPRMATTFAKGDHEQIKRYMSNSFRFVFMLAFPIIFGIIIVANNFVPKFFGSGYDKVVPIMIIISPIILFIGASNVIGTQYLLPTKRQKEYTLSVVTGAIVNFCLNLLFIPRLLAFGAAITTVIAEFSVTAVQLFCIRKEMSVLEVLKLSWKTLIASIVMFVCIYWINFVHLNGFIILAIQMLVGAIVYGIMLLILKEELLKLILEKFKDRLKVVNLIYNMVWKRGENGES